MSDYFTINIREDTYMALKARKIHPNQSFDEVIKVLLAEGKATYCQAIESKGGVAIPPDISPPSSMGHEEEKHE